MPKDTIHKKVNKLVRDHGVSDPFQLCKKMGVRVRYRDFGGLLGMYTMVKGIGFIFLSKSMDERTQRMVLAHELGHAVLHRALLKEVHFIQEFTLMDVKTSTELEANIFAAHLLLPDETVIEYLESGYTDEQIAGACDVDLDLLLIKFDAMRKEMGMDLRLRHQPKSVLFADRSARR